MSVEGIAAQGRWRDYWQESPHGRLEDWEGERGIADKEGRRGSAGIEIRSGLLGLLIVSERSGRLQSVKGSTFERASHLFIAHPSTFIYFDTLNFTTPLLS